MDEHFWTVRLPQSATENAYITPTTNQTQELEPLQNEIQHPLPDCYIVVLFCCLAGVGLGSVIGERTIHIGSVVLERDSRERDLGLAGEGKVLELDGRMRDELRSEEQEWSASEERRAGSYEMEPQGAKKEELRKAWLEERLWDLEDDKLEDEVMREGMVSEGRQMILEDEEKVDVFLVRENEPMSAAILPQVFRDSKEATFAFSGTTVNHTISIPDPSEIGTLDSYDFPNPLRPLPTNFTNTTTSENTTSLNNLTIPAPLNLTTVPGQNTSQENVTLIGGIIKPVSPPPENLIYNPFVSTTLAATCTKPNTACTSLTATYTNFNTAFTKPNTACTSHTTTYIHFNTVFTKPVTTCTSLITTYTNFNTTWTNLNTAYTKPTPAYTKPDTTYTASNTAFTNTPYANHTATCIKPNAAYTKRRTTHITHNTAYTTSNTAHSTTDTVSTSIRTYTISSTIHSNPNTTYTTNLSSDPSTRSYKRC
ncbi:hypothetical protein E2C01_040804 [Portunus trituberculatus]|uniref:Uncharacterized protein n=1 Tax=Portunus trituberculatus TaxID=210409 RepID=A0A5B7FP72_PORTR|nr:hypothetical protein [Portunus trituberculatus]